MSTDSFTGQRSEYCTDLRTEFYCEAEAMLLGHKLDAPDWLPCGGAYVFAECRDADGTILLPEHPGAMVPRGEVWVPPSTRYDRGMKSDDVNVVPSRGGKRAGAGRPALDDEGTVVLTVRLTGKQKATYDMLGGKEWLRGQLDLFAHDGNAS